MAMSISGSRERSGDDPRRQETAVNANRPEHGVEEPTQAGGLADAEKRATSHADKQDGREPVSCPESGPGAREGRRTSRPPMATISTAGSP